MRIGVVSTLYPTPRNPTAGIFVKEELDNLSCHVEIKLLAPFPNQHWFYERRPEIPPTEYSVLRPFTLAFPGWFLQRLYPSSLAVTLRRTGRNFFRDCDIVHAHNVFPEGVAAVKAFGERFPVIITVHGSDINYFAMKPDLRPGIVSALNNSQRVICVSSALKKKIEGIGVTTETVVIPNGIDTGLLGPGDKESAAKVLGLNPDRPRILFAGNFVAVKGVEYLIKSMPAVLEKYPGCELILLGAGTGMANRHCYVKHIKDAGVKDVVKIMERVPHECFPPWVHASDLLALPSISEGFGLVAAESLACGRPVVSTTSGGPEDIVGEGMGLLVPPKNPDALARAILKVLDGDGILNSEYLVESARSRFSYNIVTEKILKVYNEL